MGKGTINNPNDVTNGAQLPLVGTHAAFMGPNPYEVTKANVTNDFPGWAHDENQINLDKAATDHQRRILGHTRLETAYYGNRPDNHKNKDLLFEQVSVANQGPMSKDPTPDSRGKHPYEPNNNPPDDPRPVHAGIGYTFYRDWVDAIRDSQGFSGDHISLADNKVILPVGGMRPNYERNKRNTFRLEPTPWDSNLVDLYSDPSKNQTPPADPVVPIDTTHSRSYRLG